MFNREFYPTPAATRAQMLDGIYWQGKKVWEPEAGKGDLVKDLQSRGAEVIASENHDDLRKILQTICPLIGRNGDMLLVTSDKISHVDYIVMNPPFSQAATHILHAWKIAPAGCKLIALCNLETLKNTYSVSRQELKEIVEIYGGYQDIGDAFSDAERTTGVNVALIRIDKPGEANKEFDGFFMEEEVEDQANGLIPYNIVRDLVNRYVGAVKIFDEQLATAERLNDMCEGYFGQREIGMQVTKENKPLRRNEFKKDMQRAGWNWIFEKLNMQKHSTRGLREDINKFVETQQEVPFTMRNIYKMIEIVIGTTGARMDKAIEEVFDRVTQHTHENRYGLPGWQTNSHYLLNRKFIIPNMAPQDKWSSGNKIDNAYGSYFDLMEDLNKAMCFITGSDYDSIGTLSQHIRKSGQEYGTYFNWSFFKCKAFKKGTMHFEFLDEKVWAAFNQRVAKIKGYPLPEKQKQTKWQEQRQGARPEGAVNNGKFKVYATI